ncbi:hypothetical protein HK104_005096 [Borealophlyctis nickersoniae]|nr:hypothetical protein HK104_005096 [Borealophlyctis nickersoniae]
MDTTTYNVGGQRFQINKALVQKYPKSRLASLAAKSKGQEVFVDANPQAFAVILDYLRYDRLLVPPSVCREVVQLQLQELDIPFAQMDQLPIDQLEPPPSYRPSTGASMAMGTKSDSTRVDIPTELARATQSKLNSLITNSLLPRLRTHASNGIHTLSFFFLPRNISKSAIVSHLTNGSDAASATVEFVTLDGTGVDGDVSIEFLGQPGVLEELKKMAVWRLSVKKVAISSRDITTRVENDLGLFESCSVRTIEVVVDIV